MVGGLNGMGHHRAQPRHRFINALFGCLFFCAVSTTVVQVTNIKANYLTEMAPNYYRSANPNRLSRAKRRQRIHPLEDKWRIGSWRISKQKKRR